MEKKEKLSFWTKVIYGAGDLGFSMNNSIIAAYFPIFMMDVIGITPGLAAIILFIGRSWDYVNDPIIGFLSRPHPHPLGTPAPVPALRGAAVRPSPLFSCGSAPISSQTGLIIYYSLGYIVYEAMATIVYMPYYALTAGTDGRL